MTRPPPEDAERMRVAVEVIAASGVCAWNTPAFARKLARAYVWGVYIGEDPYLTLGRVTYGQVTVDEAIAAGVLREWLHRDVHGFKRWLERVGWLNLALPVAAERAAA